MIAIKIIAIALMVAGVVFSFKYWELTEMSCTDGYKTSRFAEFRCGYYMNVYCASFTGEGELEQGFENMFGSSTGISTLEPIYWCPGAKSLPGMNVG